MASGGQMHTIIFFQLLLFLAPSTSVCDTKYASIQVFTGYGSTGLKKEEPMPLLPYCDDSPI